MLWHSQNLNNSPLMLKSSIPTPTYMFQAPNTFAYHISLCYLVFPYNPSTLDILTIFIITLQLGPSLLVSKQHVQTV